MAITKKKPVKDRVKAKAESVKEKVKGKIKSSTKASTIVAAAILGFVVFGGCSTATPASRATTAQYRIELSFDDSARHNTVTLTLGDGALASADSAGSTETQTATPTIDVRTRIDARYNDALAAASGASRSTLGLIGDGLTGVLDLMASKKSGTVKVTKRDGTAATVECKDGQCSFVDSATYDSDFPPVDDGINR